MMIANTGVGPSAQGGLPLNRSDAGTNLRVSEAGRMILAEVGGPLDAENTPRALARLLPLSGPSRRIVLDLRRTEFVDSAGIRGLLNLQVRAEQAGAELRIVTRPGGQIHKILRMLRLESRFEIFSTVVDAWITRWSDRRNEAYRGRQAA